MIDRGTVNNACARFGDRHCFRVHLGREYDGHPLAVYNDDTHAAVYILSLIHI